VKQKSHFLLLTAVVYLLVCPGSIYGQTDVTAAQDQEFQETPPSQDGTDLRDSVDEASIPLDPPEQAVEGGGDSNFEVLSIWDFVRMILILGGVVVVIFIIFQLLKRSSTPRLQGGEIIRLLGSQPLMGNKSLHLIEVGNQIFLVGAGDTSVSLVSEITDKESVDIVRLAAAGQRGADGRSFPEMLQSMFGRSGRTEDTVHQSAAAAESEDETVFLRRQRERLQRL
jgi:flagellar protein FliO/FliZ